MRRAAFEMLAASATVTKYRKCLSSTGYSCSIGMARRLSKYLTGLNPSATLRQRLNSENAGLKWRFDRSQRGCAWGALLCAGSPVLHAYAKDPVGSARIIPAWYTVARTPPAAPVQFSRVLAMVHAAMHDA